ncbi:MAG: hypothetical protein K9I94_05855 [Bacteroidales bacterium]|nr:hypothetical protein [Bacteroidales bacterium]
MAGNSSSKRRKVRYRKITFKLSTKEKSVIDRFCRTNGITPNKFYKTAIREYLQNNSEMKEADFILENQLKLFDPDDNGDVEESPEEEDVRNVEEFNPRGD